MPDWWRWNYQTDWNVIVIKQMEYMGRIMVYRDWYPLFGLRRGWIYAIKTDRQERSSAFAWDGMGWDHGMHSKSVRTSGPISMCNGCGPISLTMLGLDFNTGNMETWSFSWHVATKVYAHSELGWLLPYCRKILKLPIFELLLVGSASNWSICPIYFLLNFAKDPIFGILSLLLLLIFTQI